VAGGLTGGLLVAAAVFMLTYDSLAPQLEHRDIFPAEAAFASAILAAFVGAFGALAGALAGRALGLLALKRKPLAEAKTAPEGE
jgi:hypothetical protein